jgi:hypothetical protein
MMQGLMVAQLFHRIDGKTLNGVNSRTSSYRLARLSMPQSPAPKHIEEGYEEQGVPEKEAERRAWVTVNKQDHGGKKSASGVGCAKDTSSSRKGRRRGGRASANRPSAARSRSGKKAAATRRSRGSGTRRRIWYPGAVHCAIGGRMGTVRSSLMFRYHGRRSIGASTVNGAEQ